MFSLQFAGLCVQLPKDSMHATQRPLHRNTTLSDNYAAAFRSGSSRRGPLRLLAPLSTSAAFPSTEPDASRYRFSIPMGPFSSMHSNVRPSSKADHCDDDLDILEMNLLRRELQYLVYSPGSKYLDSRVGLVQLMINTQEDCELQTKTSAVACNLLDRTLSVAEVPKRKWQLVALCCLLMAAKFEESIDEIPTIDKILKYSIHGYTKKQLIAMERSILLTLDWDLHAVTFMDFVDIYMERLRKQQQSEEEFDHGPWNKSQRIVKILMQQLIEIVLSDYTFNQWRPSAIGACVFAANRIILDLSPKWPHSFSYSQFSLSELGPCVQYLLSQFRQLYCNL